MISYPYGLNSNTYKYRMDDGLNSISSGQTTRYWGILVGVGRLLLLVITYTQRIGRFFVFFPHLIMYTKIYQLLCDYLHVI